MTGHEDTPGCLQGGAERAPEIETADDISRRIQLPPLKVRPTLCHQQRYLALGVRERQRRKSQREWFEGAG